MDIWLLAALAVLTEPVVRKLSPKGCLSASVWTLATQIHCKPPPSFISMKNNPMHYCICSLLFNERED